MAKLIARLEANGVLWEELSPSDFYGENPSQDDNILFDDLIGWLLAEGIIRRRGEPVGDGYGFEWTHDVVLTSKGFQLLSNRVQPNLTLREAVEKVNASEGSYSGIGELLGSFLGGFTKTVSS